MLVSGGLFDRVQVLPLKVLDERELESLHVCSVFNYYRDLYDAGPLRRPPPSFTRDYLVPAPCLADDYRLNDAFGIRNHHLQERETRRIPEPRQTDFAL